MSAPTATLRECVEHSQTLRRNCDEVRQRSLYVRAASDCLREIAHRLTAISTRRRLQS